MSTQDTKIQKIDKSLSLYKLDIKSMKRDLYELKEGYKAIDKKLDDLFEQLDNRYAKKVSVDRLWAIVWSVIAFFFVGAGGVLLSLIFKQ